MTKLIEAELPDALTREPMYIRLIPTIEEFRDSDMTCAEVKDELDPERLTNSLRNAISKGGEYGSIKVCTRTLNGIRHVYLVKV